MATSEASDRKKRLTAIGLSLFVLPGAGHWYLGRRINGACFMAATLIALFYPLLRYAIALNRAMRALAEAHGEMAALSSSLSALSNAWETEYSTLVWGCIALVICWVLAAVDVWRRS